MKIFYSESKPDYSSYTFNYGIYCLQENDDELSQILDQGFLPYSGNPNLDANIFYLARSLRINCSLYKETSENRRVSRKLESEQIEMRILKKKDFSKDQSFDHFCQSYANVRMEGKMPAKRFDYVYQKSTCSHLILFESNKGPVGYVLAAINEEVVQYWFSFFDLELMKSFPIGKWMMWKVIDWAAQNGRKYVYLGTCYGDKSLYKARDFKGLEFFDGFKWNRDVAILKEKCKADGERSLSDDLKLSTDMNQYLETFLQ